MCQTDLQALRPIEAPLDRSDWKKTNRLGRALAGGILVWLTLPGGSMAVERMLLLLPALLKLGQIVLGVWPPLASTARANDGKKIVGLLTAQLAPVFGKRWCLYQQGCSSVRDCQAITARFVRAPYTIYTANAVGCYVIKRKLIISQRTQSAPTTIELKKIVAIKCALENWGTLRGLRLHYIIKYRSIVGWWFNI